jgi:Protein of unknown function (DUF3450)
MLALVTAVLLSQSPSAVAPEGSDLARLAREVARERESVEALAADVETARQAARAELLALEARERDVSLELESVTLRTQALTSELARVHAEHGAGRLSAAQQDAAVHDALLQARALLGEGVPFDLEARTAKLAHAELLLQSVGAAAAAPALWQHLSDERALAEQVGLGRQPVAIEREGKSVRVLADTLHVGLVLLFFKTGGGSVGYAVKDAGAWRFVLAPDADARVKVLALFDAARHGAPRGAFLVPNALASSSAHGGAR